MIDVVEQSLRMLEDALALTRLFIHISSQGSYPAHDLISLRRLPNYSDIVAIPTQGSGYRESLIMRTRVYDVPLSQEDVDSWNEKYDFTRLATIIQSSYAGADIDEIDDIVVSSLIQFGNMFEEANLKDCFLRGASAVETITSQVAGQGQIAKSFREIGAALAAISQQPALARSLEINSNDPIKMFWKEVQDRLGAIYKSRCHISHGSARFSKSRDQELFGTYSLFADVACGTALMLYSWRGLKPEFYQHLNALVAKLKPS